ncbi:hypothetical protein V6N12_057560 [Hibiscus sabdariffa]|uniref:F-box associated beta-propeller type 3 domain-containing protein n=1 Tax=Hibiscus sabdariffa TaxID=183260 RepID=A0ABR2C645_9ROSI
MELSEWPLTSNAQWPDDLATSILLRFSVKSIIRFKYVLTTWRCFFDNPSFVSQHFCISKKKQRILVEYTDEYDDNFVLRMFHDTTLTTFDDWFPQFQALGNGSFCVHDGLLCVCDMTFRIRRYLEITGFGSDPILNEYKVIFFVQNLKPHKTPLLPSMRGAVYKMSTDSWRELKRKELELVEEKSFHDSTNACVNGVYYWVVSDYDSCRARKYEYDVVAFDIRKEVLQLIEWPHIPDTQQNTWGDLVIIPNIDRISLWISDSYTDSHTSNHDLWVLSEQGKCWTKLLTIGPLLEVHKLFGFWNMGKGNVKIFVQFTNRQLHLYDQQTHKFIDTRLRHKLNGYGFDIYTYEESLVTIGRHTIGYNN